MCPASTQAAVRMSMPLKAALHFFLLLLAPCWLAHARAAMHLTNQPSNQPAAPLLQLPVLPAKRPTSAKFAPVDQLTPQVPALQWATCCPFSNLVT
eukprot:CAMPEP_0202869302 /NCGR_PEP_ID=MMETSP1391-20130828/12380_1 /ASSEMBLY_ACC=CAM_ASM_000867 /TAXON_ID=1034604 /ORGANISM="Chlamydomonas leiostraca, Strain SAG 11-49" /LENGTH=95 /DNA_ID=CAMNT_0049549611 /DNA_START=545 /DNA_END=832 /DNA_ORIENTATION=-